MHIAVHYFKILKVKLNKWIVNMGLSEKWIQKNETCLSWKDTGGITPDYPFSDSWAHYFINFIFVEKHWYFILQVIVWNLLLWFKPFFPFILACRSIWGWNWCCNAILRLLLWKKACFQSTSAMLLRQTTLYHIKRCCLL